jgi:3-hydroxyisobutyrate dehydrogenase-like beta-hydroxyacid dehydrogenase
VNIGFLGTGIMDAEVFARSLGVRLEVFESVIALFQAVADRGDGDRDVSIAREVSRRAAA